MLQTSECPMGAVAALAGTRGIKKHPLNGSRQRLCCIQPGEADG